MNYLLNSWERPLEFHAEQVRLELGCRNVRHAFIIPHDIALQDLIFLMKENLNWWGGRYNQIIVSTNGEICLEGRKCLRTFDPDYVFVPEGFSIEKLEELTQCINVIETSYSEGDLKPIEGVSVLHFIPQNSPHKLAATDGYLYKHLPDLWNYYELNFGFFNGILDREEFYGIETEELSSIDLPNMNQWLTKNLLVMDELSRKGQPAIYLAHHKKLGKKLCVIVSKGSGHTEDFVYYWNRELFIVDARDSRHQLIVTQRELDILVRDELFLHYVNRISYGKGIHLASKSLNSDELEHCRSLLTKDDILKVETITVDDLTGKLIIDQGLQSKKVLFMQTNNSIMEVAPIPSGRNLGVGRWMIESQIFGHSSLESLGDHWKLPRGFDPTMSMFHLKRANKEPVARVTKHGNACLLVGQNSKHLEIRIPDPERIVQPRLWLRRINNRSMWQLQAHLMDLSSDGRKLRTLLLLFQEQGPRWMWEKVHDYFGDEFWLHVFRSTSSYKKSNLPTSRGVFCLADLMKEIELIIQHEECFAEADLPEPKEMEKRLYYKLDEMISLNLVFMGIKIKCAHCGSHEWYRFDELTIPVACKGCTLEVHASPEPRTFYKVNSVIRGNLLADQSKSGGRFGGNYVVLMALHQLTDVFYSGGDRMLFLPPTDVEYYMGDGVLDNALLKTDIDFTAVLNGKFVIGEAKVDAADINKREVTKMAALANLCRPDHIYFAYKKGEVSDSDVEELRKQLDYKPIIRKLRVPPPRYKFLEGWKQGVIQERERKARN